MARRSGSISEIRNDRTVPKQPTYTDSGRRKSEARAAVKLFKEAPFLLQVNGMSFTEEERPPFEFTAKEFAKQLTLMTANFFRSIPRKEFESIQWTSPKKNQITPCIVKMTTHFNLVLMVDKISLWIAQQILDASKIKDRMQLITYFIHVAQVVISNQALLEFDNFDTLKSIISALQSTPVYRLSRTWALVGRKERDVFQKLEEITSIENNNEKYRKIVNASKPPFIPYLGIYLSDLTYIHECLRKDKDNPDRKAQFKERQIQFEQMLDDVNRIQQNCLYSFAGNLLGQAAIEYQYSMGSKDVNLWSDMQYQQSYTIEPRDGSIAPKEENEWKFSSLKLYRTSKSSMKNMPIPHDTPSMTLPVRGVSMIYDNPTSPLAKQSKQRPRLDILFTPPVEQSSTTEIPLEEAEIVPIENTKGKKSKIFGNFLKPFRRRQSSSREIVDGSQTSLGSTPEIISSQEDIAQKPSELVAPETEKARPKALKIHTTYPQNAEESALSPVPWEARGTLHLQAVLFKKDEFDEEGVKCNQKNWQEVKVELEASKLAFSTPRMKDKQSGMNKSNPLLAVATKNSGSSARLDRGSAQNLTEKTNVKGLVRYGSGENLMLQKSPLKHSSSLSNLIADIKTSQKPLSVSPLTVPTNTVYGT
jgi:hypothetical protein